MAAGGSVKVVLIALLMNTILAIAKFVAAFMTKSGAMLAEALHSVADAGNQVLLLVGEKRSDKAADVRHPLGYGRESYFWAMLVAVILFTMGGLYSLTEGWHKLHHPEPLSHPWVAIGVLLFGIVLDSISMIAALKEVNKERGKTPFFTWAKQTGRVNLLVITFEDAAALCGLVLALAAVLLAWLLENPLFDAIGTILIGVLLLAVAVYLANQIRRLIVGFSVQPKTLEGIRGIWKVRGFDVIELAAIWGGPDEILVLARVKPVDLGTDAATLIELVNAAEREICTTYPLIRIHYVEPDLPAAVAGDEDQPSAENRAGDGGLA